MSINQETASITETFSPLSVDQLHHLTLNDPNQIYPTPILENGDALIRMKTPGLLLPRHFPQVKDWTDERYEAYADKWHASDQLIRRCSGLRPDLLPGLESVSMKIARDKVNSVERTMTEWVGKEEAMVGVNGIRQALEKSISERLTRRAAEIGQLIRTAGRDLWLVGEVGYDEETEYYAGRFVAATPNSTGDRPGLSPVVEGKDGSQGLLPTALRLGVYPLHCLKPVEISKV